MSDFSFIDLLNGYESGKDSDSIGKKFYAKSISGSVGGHSRSGLLSRVGRVIKQVARTFAYSSTRFYGLFLLGFGLMTLLIHFVKDYLGIHEQVPLSVLIVGAAFAIVGIPCMVFDKPVSIALQDFAPTDFVLFEFFCLKRTHRYDSAKGIHPAFGMILGLLLAAVGAFTPVLYVVGALSASVYICLAFLSPEFSLFSTFLIMPYLSLFDVNGLLLSAFVGVNLLSFVRKVAIGKRVYSFEQYDMVILLFLLFVLITGVFVKGIESFANSLVMILLATGYILSGCLVANRRLADCLINALIISSVPVSFLAIFQFAKAALTDRLDGFTGAHATFSSPSVLATFLIVATVFCAYFINVRRNRAGKLLYAFILVLSVTALFFTYHLWAIISLLVGSLGYFAFRMRRGTNIVLLLLSVLPSAVIFIPERILLDASQTQIFGFLNLGEFAVRWQSAKAMLLDNLFAGVGIGSDCFLEEIEKYNQGGELFASSGNFLFEIACEAGIFALIVFLCVFLIRARHRSIYRPYANSSQVSSLYRFSAVVTVSLSVYGAFNYLWEDMTMFFLFWCVFGVGSATLRVAKKEFDDRVGYFALGSSAESSSCDIGIR